MNLNLNHPALAGTFASLILTFPEPGGPALLGTAPPCYTRFAAAWGSA